MRTFLFFTFLVVFLNVKPFFAQGNCQDSSLIDPGMICPTVIDLVCGCDGVTYNNGCEATFYYGITNYTAGPCSQNSCEADFTYNVGQSQCEYVFTGTGASNYFWDFGDGNSGQGENITHLFSEDGTYIVEMLSMNQNGIWCDTVFQTLVVSGCNSIDTCSLNWAVEGDGNCNYVFLAQGANSYEWFYDDMVFVGDSISLFFPPDNTIPICLYGYNSQEELCDTICEVFTCPLSSTSQLNQFNTLRLYPNPLSFQQELTIGVIPSNLESIEIFNSIGKKIMFEIKTIDQERIKVRLFNAKMGVYYIYLINKNGIFKEKLVLIE